MKKTPIALVLFAIASIAFGADADTISRERSRILVDTNATTIVTNYSAYAGGQLLVGKSASSNTVWISTTSGTGGWTRLAITAP